MYAIIVNISLQFSLFLIYSFLLLTALNNIGNVQLELYSFLTSEIEVHSQIHCGKNWKLGEPQRHSGRFGAWKNILSLS
jgi:hypothetical protein